MSALALPPAEAAELRARHAGVLRKRAHDNGGVVSVPQELAAVNLSCETIARALRNQ